MSLVGLLPAGGAGRRLAPFRYPKELLPIVFDRLEDDPEAVRPRAVSEYALQAFAAAHVERCIVIIAPWKLELVSYLGDGREFDLSLAYVMQDRARGLPAAVDLAYPWTAGHDVCFAMPDTVLSPRNAIALLYEFFLQQGADLALAVFPTNEPERLGPVQLDGDRVLRVFDKPLRPVTRNTWGAAIWSTHFTEMLHQELATAAPSEEERAIGNLFAIAIDRGLAVRGLYFAQGAFADVGTPQGIRRFLEGSLRVGKP